MKIFDTILVIIFSFLPALFWLWFFYRKDKFEPEPIRLVIKVFLLGCFSTVFALIANATLIKSAYKNGLFSYTSNIKTYFFMFFVIVGPVEEMVKFLVLKLFISNNKNFNEIMDGIIYGISVGLGFAFVENIFYFFKYVDYSGSYISNQDFKAGVLTICIRFFTANIAHAIVNGIMGYYMGLARFSKYKRKYLIIGVLYAILIHAIYDFSISSFTNLQIIILPLMIIFSYRFLSKKIDISLSLSPFNPKFSKAIDKINSVIKIPLSEKTCLKCGLKNPAKNKFCSICKTYLG